MEQYHYKEEIQNAYERLLHPLAIYQYLDGRIIPIVLSDGFCEMFGYKNQEEASKSIRKNIYSGIHPKDLPNIKNEIHRFLEERNGYETIYRIRPYNGTEYKMIRAVGKPEQIGEDIYLAHIWYTDESIDVNQKIINLKDSISSLLKHMPAMTFTKDIKTRKYLACNQSFAEYANKEKPEDVVGLTDFEIFDKGTAEHFIEDDKRAIEMDKPYIFYEDVFDAEGNRRQFQTTKLKFINASGRACLLGLCQDVTEAMLVKIEYDKRLENVINIANVDALTGIRNKYAYQVLEEKMNMQIEAGTLEKFAITVFDVNNLKVINDTLGHQAGDEYIKEACKLICDTFKHSPVFRIGGDEFVAVSVKEDYECLDMLLKAVEENNNKAKNDAGMVVACGTARYCNEKSVSEVFIKADKNMYKNKHQLKRLGDKE